jgi:hypothetical protein
MFMSRLRSDSGFAAAALLIGVGSVLAGGAAATAAVITVVKSYGPGDAAATQDGPKDVLPPDEVLTYGG